MNVPNFPLIFVLFLVRNHYAVATFIMNVCFRIPFRFLRQLARILLKIAAIAFRIPINLSRQVKHHMMGNNRR
jgi:hypothetical protein